MSEQAQVAVIPEKKLPIKLGVSNAALIKLENKYKDIPDAKTKEGYQDIINAKRELVPLRTGVEAERKLQVAAAVDHQKRVNSVANKIKTRIEAIEKPLYDAKKKVDDEAAEKKRAGELKEQNRITDIKDKVINIQALTANLLGADVEKIKERMVKAESVVITTSEFMEFVEPASVALDQVKKQLSSAVETAKSLAAQKAQLDAQQADIKETQRKADLQESIGRIRMAPVDLVGAKVADIQKSIDKLETINVIPDYGDLSDDADKAIEETVKKLEAMVFQQQSLDNQQAEIDKQKQEQDDRELEAQRLENVKAEEKRLAIEQEEADKQRIATDAEMKARLPEDVKLREYGKSLETVVVPFIDDTYMLTIQSRAVTMVEDIVKFINDNTQEPA